MIKKYDFINDDETLLRAKLLQRSQIGMDAERAVVVDILKDVRTNGLDAVLNYGEKFDGVRLSFNTIEVTEDEIAKAVSEVEPKMLKIMEDAAANIADFHQKQRIQGFMYQQDGCRYGQRVLPLGRVGIYAPGGLASYPSTVLMDTIPAKIAGVGEIIMCTPPNYSPLTLAAAKIAGVDRIFKIGGAQAIGAMAYGIAPIPAVDKIVGPGNIYVALAKREVFGVVGIDMVAGPSEVLVIADSGANPKWVAADLLSQAEHDPNAAAILITTDADLLEQVDIQLTAQLERLPKADIARTSIDTNGALVLVKSLEQAIELSNSIAPEHLELAIDNPDEYLEQVTNAGSIFMGHYSPEPVGDYYAGPNHVLPTSGTARYASPLGVYDFIKRSSVLYYSKEKLQQTYCDIAEFAASEGLDAHANSAKVRFEDID